MVRTTVFAFDPPNCAIGSAETCQVYDQNSSAGLENASGFSNRRVYVVNVDKAQVQYCEVERLCRKILTFSSLLYV